MAKKSRILIMAAEEADTDYLVKSLAEHGYVPSISHIFREDPLVAISTEKPDLIIIDLLHKNGFDGLEIAQKINDRINLPLIFIAPRGNRWLLERSIERYPLAYLVEPIDPEPLCNAVEIALARYRQEEKLRLSEAKYRTIYKATGVALMSVNKDGIIELVNEEFTDLTGFTATDVQNKKLWSELLTGSQLLKRKEKLNLEIANPRVMPTEFKAILTCNDFSTKTVQAQMKKSSSSDHRVITFYDITKFKHTEDIILKQNRDLKRSNEELTREIIERESIEKQLRHQATHDYLTGLPNREILFDRLQQTLAYEERHSSDLMALMILDLDKFKKINDSLGHICGDVLLKEVANRLYTCMRQYDTVVRFGGDEFIIICKNMPDYESIAKFAQKVKEVFQTPFRLLDHLQAVTASIGIAIFPFHGNTSDELIKKADRAMYEAKKIQNKSSLCFYSKALDAIDSKQNSMAAKLQKAFDRNEFFTYFQPRLNTATGRITGMEALMRWKPEGSLIVQPAEFIDILEDTGLILPVSERLLLNICQQNKAWQDEGIPPMRVAIKVSDKQFRQNNLPQLVEQSLKKSGLDPKYLELELSENTIMKYIGESSDLIKHLKKIGVSLSIDHFGTGYTSLSYLNKLPVDELKIDRSLIKGLTVDEGHDSIVSALIAMGHNIGKRIVAQGVESRKQLNFLSKHQCEGVQGYLFYRPLPSKTFGNIARQMFATTTS